MTWASASWRNTRPSQDLASRDVVSRAMYLEMREGRGIGGKRYLYLDMRPETVNKYAALDGRKRPDGSPYTVTGEELLSKLPDIVDFARTYLGVDPVAQLMPIQRLPITPWAAYPTNKFAEVVIDEQNTVCRGCMRPGVRLPYRYTGPNRLGTNSLLDLIVFGKYAGLRAAEFSQALPSRRCQRSGRLHPPAIGLHPQQRSEEKAYTISNEMKAVNVRRGGGLSQPGGMQKALDKVHELQERLKHVRRPTRQDFQHRADQHLGAGQPARPGRDHHRLGNEAH